MPLFSQLTNYTKQIVDGYNEATSNNLVSHSQRLAECVWLAVIVAQCDFNTVDHCTKLSVNEKKKTPLF